MKKNSPERRLREERGVREVERSETERTISDKTARPQSPFERGCREAAGDVLSTRTCLAICAGLVLLCALVFGRITGHGFINCDDDRFLVDNAQVQSGLSWATVAWAFTNHVESYWMPLSWLSHALDCQLYGMWGGGHHLTSLIIHAVNAALLFLVLLRLTGAQWPSAMVAALFAVHPLHVESVVWASERKDVLSTLFWCLTLLAYTYYAAKPMVRRYLLVVALYALALMSKPMVVTLPCLLLLLDYWPLDRIRFETRLRAAMGTGARLALEKLPMFALAAAAGAAAYILQGRGAQTALAFDDKSLPLRLGNAVVSYAFFLAKLVLPSGLSVVYPWPIGGFPAWQVAGAALLLLAVTAIALVMAKRRPWLIVGWLWYLGLMAPTMQVLQRHTFAYARADRYTYCALIGITVMIVWTARDVLGVAASKMPKNGRQSSPGIANTAAAALGGVAVLACAALSVVQVGYWQDSISLFQHALDVTSDNGPAQVSLGRALQNAGRFGEAELRFRKALERRPKDGTVLNNLGVVVQAQGRFDEAQACISQALKIDPNDADALANMGAILKAQNKNTDAEVQLRKALEVSPDHLLSLTNMSAVLQAQGRFAEAETYARKALELSPGQIDALYSLGVTLQAQARYSEAEPLFRKVLEHDPDHVSALSNLGAALLSQKKYAEAKTRLTKALTQKPDHVTALINMGMVLQAQGDCMGAKTRFLRVLALKPDAIMAMNSLAWIYATAADESCRDGKKAVEYAQRVVAIIGMKPDEPHAKTLDILAAAYARDGQYEKAVEAEQKAVELLNASANVPQARTQELAQAFEQRLRLYGAKTPYVDPAAGSGQ